MNTYSRALRAFQDRAEDVTRARYRTFDDAIRRFGSTLTPGTPLGDVVAQLPVVDFDAWYREQEATVRSVIDGGRLTWPDDDRARLAMQVALVRRLAAGRPDILDFTRQFMWVRNDFDDHVAEFVQQVFRPFTRDFLRLAHDTPAFAAGLSGAGTVAADNGGPVTDELTLFISHAGADAATAKALITLFEKALKISARRIRCTSVEGYRLPVGADTNEALRIEVFGAKLFIALLTPTSLKSHYVLFELGARWGARRPLFPVLANGTTAGDLRAPLNGLNALNAAVPDQLRLFVEDAAQALGERLEPMASFSAEIDAAAAASAAIATTPGQLSSGEPDEHAGAPGAGAADGGSEWEQVEVEGKRYAWDGPIEDLKESYGVPLPDALVHALTARGMRPTTGIPGDLWNEFSKGYQQVWYVDGRMYKHPVVSNDKQVLLVKPAS